jgi:hypothetical protein
MKSGGGVEHHFVWASTVCWTYTYVSITECSSYIISRSLTVTFMVRESADMELATGTMVGSIPIRELCKKRTGFIR